MVSQNNESFDSNKNNESFDSNYSRSSSSEGVPHTRLLLTMRNSGLTNRDAIADIVDNSFDAEASRIDIKHFEEQGELHIEILDDGIGMDEKDLIECLTLASISGKNPDDNDYLGCFGVGLKNSALAIGKCFEVITLRDEKLLYAKFDLDDFLKEDRWDVAIKTISQKPLEESPFGKNDSGTLIKLSKLDRISNKSISWRSPIKKHLSVVFADYMKGKVSVYIGGKDLKDEDKINPIDVLMLEDKNTIRRNDISFTYNSNEKIIVKSSIIPDKDEGKEILGRNQRDSGFYIFRNGRCIVQGASGESFLNSIDNKWQRISYLWRKHNSNNRIRIKIELPSSYDSESNINFTKTGVNFSMALSQKLMQEIHADLKSMYEIVKSENNRLVKDEWDDIGEEIQDIFNKKQKFFDLPKNSKKLKGDEEKEKRETPEIPEKPGTVKPTSTGGPHKNLKHPKYKITLKVVNDKSRVCHHSKDGDQITVEVSDVLLSKNKTYNGITFMKFLAAFALAEMQAEGVGDDDGKINMNTVHHFLIENMSVLDI
jgi:hypothetical protein